MTAVAQHEVALQLGNDYRAAKRDLRAFVRGTDRDSWASRCRLADILEDGVPIAIARTELLGAKTIHQALLWPFKANPADARATLRLIGASSSRMLGDLTDRQLHILCGVLRDQQGARALLASLD